MGTNKVKRCAIGQSLEDERQYYDDSHKDAIKGGKRNLPKAREQMDHYFQAVSNVQEHDSTCKKCAEAVKNNN